MFFQKKILYYYFYLLYFSEVRYFGINVDFNLKYKGFFFIEIYLMYYFVCIMYENFK